MEKDTPRCRHCKSRKTVFAGNYANGTGSYKRVKCNNCHRIFVWINKDK